MSDYEGDDWDRVDLSSRVSSIKPNGAITPHCVAPQGQSLQTFESERRQKREFRKPKGRPLEASFHPVIQRIQPRSYHGTGGRSLDHPSAVFVKTLQKESKNRFEQSPDNADHVYELPCTWSNFIHLTRPSSISVEEMASRRLEVVRTNSQAYIKPPDKDSNKIEIWGTKDQCSDAAEMISKWEVSNRHGGIKRQNPSFPKMTAFDGREEHRLMQEELREQQEAMIREADDKLFSFEAYLIWPINFDLDDFLTKTQPTILDSIAKGFRCRFNHERRGRNRFTKVQAESEPLLLAAYQRLINLVKECVAYKSRGIHGNFSRCPSLEAWRNYVGVSYDQNMKYWNISLEGDRHGQSDGDKENFFQLQSSMDRKTRKELQASLDSFVKNLFLTQCHVRMRIDFGDFGLRSFDRSKVEVQDCRDLYKTDDFFDMVNNDRTELTDCMFRAPGKSMTELPDLLAAMDGLTPIGNYYRAMFDFLDKEHQNRLRLEAEFQQGHDVDDAEPCAQRWLTSKAHRNVDNVLGLKVLDLQNPSFMIRADCSTIHKNEAATADMYAFQSSVSYRPLKDGFRAPARRRTFYEPGRIDLGAITEVVARRYNVKGTEGTLEIRREDYYETKSGRKASFPAVTKWCASYYYQEWDNLLGDLANLQPGEQLKWDPAIRTLFPESHNSDHPKSLPKGFKGFLRDVGQVQTLLQTALSRLPPATC